MDMATNTTTGGMGGHWVVLLTRGCLKCMDTTQGVVGFVCGVGEQAHGACVCCVVGVFVVWHRCVLWFVLCGHQHTQPPINMTNNHVLCTLCGVVLKANEWQQCNTSSGPLVCCVVVWHHQHHCACCCCWWWWWMV